MAKAKAPKTKTRRKSRKPKTIELAGMECKLLKGGGLEWEGHKLNPEQVALFQVKVAERLDIAHRPNSTIEHPGTYARKIGFDDLLWTVRPTTNAKQELLAVTSALGRASVTIGTLRDFHFHTEGPARTQAAELLRQLAEDCGRQVKKLQHLAESIKLEGSTKLQDWTARWKEYDAV